MKVQRVSWKDPAETICFLWFSIQVCKGVDNELGTTDLEPSLASARAKSKTLSNCTNSLHLGFLLKRKICGCSTRVCISYIHCSWLRETNHFLHWHALSGKVSKKSILKQVYPWYNHLYYKNTREEMKETLKFLKRLAVRQSIIISILEILIWKLS